MTVQDFKPSIRIKKVWDAIFNEFGYTYTSSFWNQDWLNSVYMLCDNNLKYLQLSGSYYGTESINLETYGQIKIAPISSSVGTNVTMSVAGQDYPLNWYGIQSNPNNTINPLTLVYSLPTSSVVEGNLNLSFELQRTSGTSSAGYPQFNLLMVSSSGTTYTTPLSIINNYMQQKNLYNCGVTKEPLS